MVVYIHIKADKRHISVVTGHSLLKVFVSLSLSACLFQLTTQCFRLNLLTSITIHCTFTANVEESIVQSFCFRNFYTRTIIFWDAHLLDKNHPYQYEGKILEVSSEYY